MQDQSAIREAYNQASQAYASKFIDELEGKPRDREMLQQFVKHIGQGRILDLGCGPGHTTAYIHSLGGKATGIDLSPCMIEQAKQIFPDCSLQLATSRTLTQAESVGGILAFYCIVISKKHSYCQRLPSLSKSSQIPGLCYWHSMLELKLLEPKTFLGRKQCSIFDF